MVDWNAGHAELEQSEDMGIVGSPVEIEEALHRSHGSAFLELLNSLGCSCLCGRKVVAKKRKTGDGARTGLVYVKRQLPYLGGGSSFDDNDAKFPTFQCTRQPGLFLRRIWTGK